MPMGRLPAAPAARVGGVSTGGMVMVRCGGMVGGVQTSRACCPGDGARLLRPSGLFATNNARDGRGGTSRG